MFIAAAPLLKVMIKARNQHQSSFVSSVIIRGRQSSHTKPVKVSISLRWIIHEASGYQGSLALCLFRLYPPDLRWGVVTQLAQPHATAMMVLVVFGDESDGFTN
jgi:hypothetical protein